MHPALSHLDELEAEAIQILRETAAGFERPVLMYSIGKDSTVLLHLALKAFWPGKQVYRDGEVHIGLVKGAVDPTAESAAWQVGGLAGATLTSRGVTNLVHFWLGENGFAPFLNNLRLGDA